MVTAVLFSQNAGTNTITTFHDMISNELPQLLGTWNFELKIFLNNKNSKPKAVASSMVPNRYLYTIQLSYLPGNQMISIINNSKSITTVIPSNSTDQEDSLEFSKGYNTQGLSLSGSGTTLIKDQNITANMKMDKLSKKLRNHIEKGACTNWSNVNRSVEKFDFFLQSKLQSLWNLKQTIKGEAGYGYIISVPNLSTNPDGDNGLSTGNGNLNGDGPSNGKVDRFKLRTSNCFLQGAFKGFLIEIEHLDDDEDEEKEGKEKDGNELIMKFTSSITKIKSLITMYKFPEGNLCYNVLSDSKLDYLSDLCQQYCDALQF